ncbi:MAG: YkgJ family cysteine cluster protein [Planctomycetota bacterium]
MALGDSGRGEHAKRTGRANTTDWFDRPDPTGKTDTGEVGLRFECTQCGNCCTGPPGYVHFTDDEARAMAGQLGLTVDRFYETYTRDTVLGRSLSEVETEHGFDCVLLDRESVAGKALCRVYKARPAQCRTWPFWADNVRSREAWKRASRECPGMGRGPLYAPEVVRMTVSAADDSGGPARRG